MGRYRKFTPEYRDQAVHLVIDTGRPIAAVARELGINEGTLGNWVNKYRNEHPPSEELNISERARLAEGRPRRPASLRTLTRIGTSLWVPDQMRSKFNSPWTVSRGFITSPGQTRDISASRGI